MKKKILIIFMAAGLTASAQEFEWQWAKRGGGTKLSPNETATSYNFDSEQILDIAVDNNNNYYYLAFMTEQNTTYDDMPVTVYNSIPQATGATDIVLVSTDCSGAFRWSKTIGGGSTDYAYKIELDNSGGLYIGANVLNLSNLGEEYLPPRFDDDDVMPVIGPDTGESHEGYKMASLLKYDTADGSLEWRVMPQGDVTANLRYASINQVALSSDGTVHTLIGFLAGSHLEGAVTVPETFTGIYKYFIVKFDSNGNYLSNIPLSLEGVLLENNTEFRYDEAAGNYIVAGFRTNGDIFALSPLSLNGTELEHQAFVMAFNGSGSNIWVKQISSDAQIQDNRIYDLQIDDESNLYLTGKYFINFNSPGVNFEDYDFPDTVEGNIPFVLKLNSSAAVQWITTPTGYTTPDGSFTGADYNYNLVLNGEEIAVSTQVSNEEWGTISVNRPANHRSDPALLRLNKSNGTAIAIHDIMGAAGYDDALTAVAVDNDGNYITGGYFYSGLFTNENDNVPTLNKVMDVTQGTDFFIAKLASGPCGETAAIKDITLNNIKLYPNPSNGIINIETQYQLHSYEVMSVLGQVLLKADFSDSQKTLSVENLNPGTYIINIKTADNKTVTQKIIKL